MMGYRVQGVLCELCAEDIIDDPDDPNNAITNKPYIFQEATTGNTHSLLPIHANTIFSPTCCAVLKRDDIGLS
jgi:hypothetical protein